MVVPPEAVRAAAKAIREDGWSDDTLGTINRVARVALEAAAPAIAAAERECIRERLVAHEQVCAWTASELLGEVALADQGVPD